MTFKEIKPPSEKSPIWEPNDGDVLEGVLENTREKVGPNESFLYEIKKTNGELVNVWGSTGLDGPMSLLKRGDTIRILFEGMKQNPRSGRTFKSFKVFRDDPGSTDD